MEFVVCWISWISAEILGRIKEESEEFREEYFEEFLVEFIRKSRSQTRSNHEIAL